jgi:hypothetical protein
MFKSLRSFFLITIGLTVALAGAALAPDSISLGQKAQAATTTPEVVTVIVTPFSKEEMVPGDTNIILLLGAILVVIIITAIMWHRRDWEK